jgi:hypothetical protein
MAVGIDDGERPFHGFVSDEFLLRQKNKLN